MSYQRKDKIIFGIIMAVWFFSWAIAFEAEPDRAITGLLTKYGVVPRMWTTLFLLAGLGASVHTIMNWRWNIIILLPFIMHTFALIFVKVDQNYAPLEAIILRLVLLVLVLSEFYKDWRVTEWKWKS